MRAHVGGTVSGTAGIDLFFFGETHRQTADTPPPQVSLWGWGVRLGSCELIEVRGRSSWFIVRVWSSF
jgi:hypothetical protein